ncbi:MAG: hypothetical protein CL572_05165 [Alphaproteobacteria bacterium]|nr:hypothetical protein [Alphaproteobacteria bacterium]
MSKKNIFHVSFFVTIFFSIFLQVSIAKNFIKINSYEICSNENSDNENSEHNFLCEFNCSTFKFDELSLKDQNPLFVFNKFVYNQTYLKEIYFKFFLSPKNNSPPKAL